MSFCFPGQNLLSVCHALVIDKRVFLYSQLSVFLEEDFFYAFGKLTDTDTVEKVRSRVLTEFFYTADHGSCFV